MEDLEPLSNEDFFVDDLNHYFESAKSAIDTLQIIFNKKTR
jgi:hypothetical protein